MITVITLLMHTNFDISLPVFFENPALLMTTLFVPQEGQPGTCRGPKHVHGQQQAHQQPGDQL